MISKYLKLDLFKQFKMDGDDIFWNRYEMSYSFFTLYYGFGNDMIQEALYYENLPVEECIH